MTDTKLFEWQVIFEASLSIEDMLSGKSIRIIRPELKLEMAPLDKLEIGEHFFLSTGECVTRKV